MKVMDKICLIPLSLSVLCLSLLGCKQSVSQNTTSIPTDVMLTPFILSTPMTNGDEQDIALSSTEMVTPSTSPTPTPVTYTVVKGDTFTSIAYLHGVKLADLIESNPDVDPNFLSVGMTITIPSSVDYSISQVNPTPIPVDIARPICYTNLIEGVWCFTDVHNTQPYDIENISAEFRLSSENLQEDIIQIAFAPINVLPTSSKIPLAVYFKPPIPKDYRVMVNPLTIIPKSRSTERYLTPILINKKIEITENDKKGVVSGEVKILEETDAEKIRIVAVAYSRDGHPVGIRKWEASSPLPQGEKRFFRLDIYSLGPQISEIILFMEAQP